MKDLSTIIKNNSSFKKNREYEVLFHNIGELLLYNSFIISDTSPLADPNANIMNKIKNITNFKYVEEDDLNHALYNISVHVDWFSKDNVFTSPKVYEETNSYSTMINDALTFFKNHKDYKIIFNNYKNSYTRNGLTKKLNNLTRKTSNLNKKNFFSEVDFQAKILRSKVRKKVLERDSISDFCVEFIEEMENNFKIKKPKLNDAEHTDRRTDEELVGYALNKAFSPNATTSQNYKVALVSCDFDIFWLTVGASLFFPEFKKDKLSVHIIHKNKIKSLASASDYAKKQQEFVRKFLVPKERDYLFFKNVKYSLNMIEYT